MDQFTAAEAKLFYARAKPAPAATCEHGQHWLLCEHCGESARAEISASMAKWRADARALWAVRVLDAWADQVPGMREVRCSKTLTEGSRASVCQLFEHARGSKYHYGHDRDAARLAAADAIFGELPEAERLRLGGKP